MVVSPDAPCWGDSLQSLRKLINLQADLRGSLKSIPLIGKTGPHAIRSGDSFQTGHKLIVKDPSALFTRAGEFVSVSGKNSHLYNCILFPCVSSNALAGDNTPHSKSRTIPQAAIKQLSPSSP